jgi:hypothetical protein
MDCYRISDYELSGRDVWYVSENKWIPQRKTITTDEQCRNECVSQPDCKLWRYNHTMKTCDLSGYDAQDVEMLNQEYTSGRVKCVSELNLLNILLLSFAISMIFVITLKIAKPCNT